MSFTYETIGTTTFLTYAAGPEDFDTFSLKMLEHNEPEGLLPFSCILENRVKKIRYAVTSYETLESYISRPLPLANILNMLESIAAAARELEEYMLYPGGIVTDPAHMYTEIGTGRTRLVYLPVKDREGTELLAFLRGLLGRIQYADPEGSVCILRISNDMNSGRITGIGGLLEAVREAKRERTGTGKQEAGLQERKQQAAAKQPVQAAEVRESRQTVPEAVSFGTPSPVRDGAAQSMPFPVPGVPVPPQEIEKEEGQSGFRLFGGKKKTGREEKKEDGKKKKQKEEKKPDKKAEKKAASPGFAIPGMEQEQPAYVEKQEQRKGDAEKKGFLNFRKKENMPSGAQAAQIEAEMPRQAVEPAAREHREAALDFGSTVLEQPDGEVAMGDGIFEVGEAGLACLLRRANGQRMYLEQEVTRIGRESAYVDFYIGDNLRIGRSHAEIIRRDGVYYIRDNHSKNHTYVNGQMVTGEELVPLNAGDVIMLANEAFEFQEV